MSKSTHPLHFKASLGLIACIVLSWLLSCSSADEAPGGRRIEYPTEPNPKTAALPSASSTPSASAVPIPSPSENASSTAAGTEPPSESDMSPLDKAIQNDYPSRPWSKNVPKRTCTNDEQCGDGFCDRGHCAPIWTWNTSYGQHCGGDQGCSAMYLCLDGRCRSCTSDAECQGTTGMQNPKCTKSPLVPGAHDCRGVVPSIVPLTGSHPPPQPPPK